MSGDILSAPPQALALRPYQHDALTAIEAAALGAVVYGVGVTWWGTYTAVLWGMAAAVLGASLVVRAVHPLAALAVRVEEWEDG